MKRLRRPKDPHSVTTPRGESRVEANPKSIAKGEAFGLNKVARRLEKLRK